MRNKNAVKKCPKCYQIANILTVLREIDDAEKYIGFLAGSRNAAIFCTCAMKNDQTYMKLDGCIVWNAHNTVFGRKSPAICAQAVHFLHSTMPSVTWLNSRWSLLPVTEWCQRYLPCCQPASDVAENLGNFFNGMYWPGKWLGIDFNGKSEN